MSFLSTLDIVCSITIREESSKNIFRVTLVKNYVFGMLTISRFYLDRGTFFKLTEKG